MNTSRVIGPILLWLFPGITPETLAAIHFAIRKLAHFGELVPCRISPGRGLCAA